MWEEVNLFPKSCILLLERMNAEQKPKQPSCKEICHPHAKRRDSLASFLMTTMITHLKNIPVLLKKKKKKPFEIPSDWFSLSSLGTTKFKAWAYNRTHCVRGTAAYITGVYKRSQACLGPYCIQCNICRPGQHCTCPKQFAISDFDPTNMQGDCWACTEVQWCQWWFVQARALHIECHPWASPTKLF